MYIDIVFHSLSVIASYDFKLTNNASDQAALSSSLQAGQWTKVLPPQLAGQGTTAIAQVQIIILSKIQMMLIINQ